MYKYLLEKHLSQSNQILKTLKKGQFEITPVELKRLVAETYHEHIEAAEAAANVPRQTLLQLDDNEEKGCLYERWKTFFDKRELRPMQSFGFMEDHAEFEVGHSDWVKIHTFLKGILSGHKTMPQDIFDLDSNNILPLDQLQTFACVMRLGKDMFMFRALTRIM